VEGLISNSTDLPLRNFQKRDKAGGGGGGARQKKQEEGRRLQLSGPGRVLGTRSLEASAAYVDEMPELEFRRGGVSHR